MLGVQRIDSAATSNTQSFEVGATVCTNCWSVFPAQNEFMNHFAPLCLTVELSKVDIWKTLFLTFRMPVNMRHTDSTPAVESETSHSEPGPSQQHRAVTPSDRPVASGSSWHDTSAKDAMPTVEPPSPISGQQAEPEAARSRKSNKRGKQHQRNQDSSNPDNVSQLFIPMNPALIKLRVGWKAVTLFGCFGSQAAKGCVAP